MKNNVKVAAGPEHPMDHSANKSNPPEDGKYISVLPYSVRKDSILEVPAKYRCFQTFPFCLFISDMVRGGEELRLYSHPSWDLLIVWEFPDCHGIPVSDETHLWHL